MVMNIDEYLEHQPTLRDEGWFKDLDDRKKEEATFHDYIRSERRSKTILKLGVI